MQPATKMTKGERTKRRLMDATRTVLEERGYQDMRIRDIAKAAGVAQGTFYLYFDNKEHATVAVMVEFMDQAERRLRFSRTSDDPFLEILEPTVAYARLVFEEASLFRAFLQFVHHHPEAATLWSDATNRWLTRVEAVMDRRMGKERTDPATRTVVAHALSWMVDGILLSYLTRDLPRLQAVLESPEQLGETLSVLWYRALYGDDPDPSHLQSGKPVLDFHLAPKPEDDAEETPED